MDGTVLARIAAIVFIAIAATAAVIEMTRENDPIARRAAAPVAEPAADPLRDQLRRCQQLGQSAADDPNCLATWAENRDRFLGRSPQSGGGQ